MSFGWSLNTKFSFTALLPFLISSPNPMSISSRAANPPKADARVNLICSPHPIHISRSSEVCNHAHPRTAHAFSWSPSFKHILGKTFNLRLAGVSTTCESKRAVGTDTLQHHGECVRELERARRQEELQLILHQGCRGKYVPKQTPTSLKVVPRTRLPEGKCKEQMTSR